MSLSGGVQVRTAKLGRFLAAVATAGLLLVDCQSAGGARRVGAQPAQEASRYAPIPRKDAFFGLHFDLHPQETDTSLGADVTENNIRELLTRVKPDFVQYDSKGHPGWAGFPTEVGWASPGIVKDSLQVWRKVSREMGIGLYAHYSGLWDSKAVKEHPEWARLDAKGERDRNVASVFGSYVDELLIPQLEELTTKYDLEGVWVDGDCWAAQLDYSPRALNAWRARTGYKEAPKDPSEPHWLEWKMFNRQGFDDYLTHWVDALHAANPALALTSNWMYSTYAPEPVEAKLDFLSGDLTPSGTVDKARLEARYLASTGMPWDLMIWGFNMGQDLGPSLKPTAQVEQEAAAILMQGGGVQIYNSPTRSGYVVEPIIRQEEAVAEFCRTREEVSHKSVSLPQVALLLSTDSYWEDSNAVYAPWSDVYDDLEGALHALLSLHYSVDVLAEHQLLPRLDEFPLVVIPDWQKLSATFRSAMTVYVERGGSLLLLGEKSARLFEPMLGVALDGSPEQRPVELASRDGVVSANGAWQKVVLTSARASGFIFPTRDTRAGGQVAATVNLYGRGRVAAVYGPIGSIYFRSHHPWLREFIGEMVSAVFADPAVRVEAPPAVDVALRLTRDGRLSVHLLNISGMTFSSRYGFSDFVAPLEGVKLAMQLPARPKAVTLVPGGGGIEWSWRDGLLQVAIKKLEIHEIVVIRR